MDPLITSKELMADLLVVLEKMMNKTEGNDGQREKNLLLPGLHLERNGAGHERSRMDSALICQSDPWSRHRRNKRGTR